MLRNISVAAAAVVAALGLAGCDVKKTQEGNVTLPKYEKTQEGNVTLPKYEVKAPEVTVGTTEKTVNVPVVGTEQKTVTVPVVGVEKKTIEVPTVQITPAEKTEKK